MVCVNVNHICTLMYLFIMSKRKMPSRVRYDLANPVIAVRVSKDEYDKLDYLRQSEDASFSDLLLRALDEKEEEHIQLGKCSKCGKEYYWTLGNEGQMNFISGVVSKAKPFCTKCKEEAKTSGQ